MRLWNLDVAARKVRASDCQTGQIKRIVRCICVDPDDEFMYCGTTTGDLLKVDLRTGLFKLAGPPKEKVQITLLLKKAMQRKRSLIVAFPGSV